MHDIVDTDCSTAGISDRDRSRRHRAGGSRDSPGLVRHRAGGCGQLEGCGRLELGVAATERARQLRGTIMTLRWTRLG